MLPRTVQPPWHGCPIRIDPSSLKRTPPPPYDGRMGKACSALNISRQTLSTVDTVICSMDRSIELPHSSVSTCPQILSQLIDIHLRYRWNSLLTPGGFFLHHEFQGNDFDILNSSVLDAIWDDLGRYQSISSGFTLTPHDVSCFS